GGQRHEDLPLRLSPAETDAVVEREKLVCSHFDAFRFFTPSAAPRNASRPTRAAQVDNDNPACLHVGMDLYKWAMKLTPLVPSSLVLDCFEHARQTRVLDMEASPYDVRPLGYGVVAIEPPGGKAEYVRRQRALAARADELRQSLLAALDGLPAADRCPAEGRHPAGCRPVHPLPGRLESCRSCCRSCPRAPPIPDRTRSSTASSRPRSPSAAHCTPTRRRRCWRSPRAITSSRPPPPDRGRRRSRTPRSSPPWPAASARTTPPPSRPW